MCGIVGCQLKRPLNDLDIKRMRHLCDALIYRGPDGSGEHIDIERGLYLGHRRLSIIDLDERSAQPMQTKRQIVTYNGEIYNYLELRRELDPYYNFKTKSDTEVLLHAWDRWGQDALLKFDGMFAFALQDAEGLHLITDFFGEKPLYLLEREEGFYFSSEAQPLIEVFELEWKPTDKAISEFMHLGYIEAPATGYVGLTALLPGTHGLINQNYQLHQTNYWRPPIPDIPQGKVSKITTQDFEKLRDILCTSVERRLRGDVKMGLFLSGGVDSALVAALSSIELSVDLQSYTTTFPDGHDESFYATQIANHLEINHTIVQTEDDQSWRCAPHSLCTLYGIPNDNMTVFAIEKMCGIAKDNLTVALTGLGGDELFYGYNKYQSFYKNEWLYQYADFLQPFLPFLAALPISKFKTAASLLKGKHMHHYFRVKNGEGQNEIDAMGLQALEHILNREIKGISHQARYFDLISTLPQSYIPAVDRGSMRQSVELRTPFLSRDLLDFVMTLDQRALIAKEKKYMLRHLLKRYMPLDLLTPAKQGFVYPFSRYFKQDNVDFSCDKNLIANNERLAMRQCLLAEMTSNSK